MTQLLQLPLWSLALWAAGFGALGYAFGFGSDLLSRRRFALRLAAEFALAFAVAAGLVLGVGGALTALSLLV